MAATLERVPPFAGVAAKLEGLDAKDLSPDHLVILAESAIQEGSLDAAMEYLRCYFKENPPPNHFLARAHLCKAILSAPQSHSELEKLTECAGHISEAINLCKKSTPYHFMVFNATVLLWKLVRPFQVLGSRCHLLTVLTTAAQALEEIGEGDEAWRVEILVALLHSQLEAKHLEDAVKTSSKALHLAKKAAPHRTAEIVRILVAHDLLDGKTARDEIKSSPQLCLLYKVMKLRNPSSAGGLVEGDSEGKLKKALESVLAHGAQSSVSGTRRGRQTSAETQMEVTPQARSPSLVELAEVCLSHNQPAVARDCMEHFTADDQDSSIVLRAELVQCQLELQQTLDNIYSKSAVEVRLNVLNRLCQVLTSAHRLGLPQLVEQGGALLWNNSLPLLQHNLRHALTQSLTQLTHYLEKEESMLFLLRCEAHFELAKCLELAGKQTMAMEHINKAGELDKTGVYQTKLDEARHRLGLSLQLYHSPEKTLDKVTALLVQLKTLPKGTSSSQYHHLMVEVGSWLAPGVFDKVLVKEREGVGERGKEITSAEFDGYLRELGSWSRRCLEGRALVEQHREVVGREEEKERCQRWCLLAKLARKHEAWSVSCAAAQFCLVVYNNGRWDMPKAAKIKMDALLDPSQTSIAASHTSLGSTAKQERGERTPQKTSTANLAQPSNSSLHGRGGSTTQLTGSSSSLKQKSQKSLKEASSSSVAQPMTDREQPSKEKGKGSGRGAPPTGDKEMLRVLSEAACLYGESLVYLLQREGLKVFLAPQPPSAAKHVRDFDPETDENWKSYCEWTQTVSSEALSSFVQSAEVAAQLKEGWMLHNAAVYMWNYGIHLVQSGEAEPLIPYYRSLLRLIKYLGTDRDPSLLCRVSTVFVRGVLSRWTPQVLEALQRQASATPMAGGKKPDKSKSKGTLSLLAQFPGAEEELKEALQACEGALQDGRHLPLPLKQPLLQSWVCLKQILQLPIDRAMGQGQETTPTAHQHCVVIAIEMMRRQGGLLGDFSFCPTVKESVDHMLLAECDDPTSSLELWAALTELAWKGKDKPNAERCAGEALKAGQLPVEHVQKLQCGGRSRGEPRGDRLSLRQCHQLLSLVCSIRGGCLESKAASDTAILKEAQQAFLTAARYGEVAPSYPHVIQACRMFWNMSLTNLSTQNGRNSLVSRLLELLDIVASLSSRRRKSIADTHAESVQGAVMGGVVGSEEDLSLRVTMYCSVLQSYADKMQWSEGLSLAEEAMQILPRTHHRELTQYRVLFKSRLSRSVEGDMVSFQEEGEGTVAAVWFKVAHNAGGTKEKMAAYKKAISTIKSSSNGWQKVEYLLEFGEWLLSSHHQKATAMAQFQDALHLVMCLESPTAGEAPPSDEEEGGGEEGEAPPSSPAPDVPLSSLKQKDLLEITSVSHLMKIMSVFIMMAEVEGRGSPAHKDHLLTALDICVIIWKVFLACHAELPLALSRSVSKDAKSGGLRSSGPPVGGAEHPTTAAAWSTFSLSDDVRTAVRDGSENNSVNKHTITNTGLTLHYLQMLVKGLHQYGLLAPSLPVLALELVIADDLADCRTWSTLVRMRIVAVCKQLHLNDAVDHHKDKMAAPFHPDDIAKSEMDMAAHTAAAEASSRELERWRSQRGASKASILAPQPSILQPTGESTSQRDVSDSSPLITVGNEPCLQWVWLEEAGLMMDDSSYNTVHQMLQQALKLSQVFEDHVTSCDILLKLAELHLREKLYSRAVELVLEAQSLPCALESCLASYTLLLDVLTAAGCSVGGVIDHGVRVFEEAGKERPNDRALVDHALNVLEYRRRLSSIREKGVCSNEEWTELVECVHQVEMAGQEVMGVHMREECCATLKSICEGRREPQDRQRLQCLFVSASRDLNQKQRTLFSSIEQHSAKSTLEGVSLPVVRCLATSQLDLAEVLVDILLDSVHQQKLSQMKSRDKPSIERLIEDYVKESPHLLEVEEAWHDIAKVAGEESLSLLTSAHTLISGSSTELLAKVYLQTGRCLLAVSNKHCPDAGMQWSHKVYDALHLPPDPTLPPDDSQMAQDGLSEDPFRVSALPPAKVGSLHQYSTLSLVMRSKEAERDQASEVVGLQFLAQAVQSLAAAVNTGLEANTIDVVSRASLALVDCIGQLDPSSSVQYLALHQSCRVAEELSSLLSQVHSSPQASRLAALIQQCCAQQGNRSLPAHTTDCPALGEYQCVQNLLISQDHLSLVRGFPANFRFIILQHSPDREKLYTGYMLPPQPPPPAAGKKTTSPKVQAPIEPVVSCVSVCAATLDDILELMSLYQKELGEGLKETEVQLGRANRKGALFAQPNSQHEEVEPPLSCPTATTDSNSSTTTASILSDALVAMEAYLGEALDLVTQAVRREEQDKKLTFVLLVDSSLAQLPLEALSVFSNETVHAVSRDFSMQMLCNRLKKFTAEEGADKQIDKTPVGKKDREKFKPQPESFLANCATAKYVVDVGKKLCAYQQKAFSHLPDQVLSEQEVHSKMTAKWSGMTKTEHLPKPSELRSLLSSATGLVYLGDKGLLDLVEPSTIPLDNCPFAMLMTVAPTAQCSGGVQWSASRSLPVMEAQVLSLCGVSAVLQNQWTLHPERTIKVYREMLKGMLADGKTMSHSYWDTVKAPHTADQQTDGAQDEAVMQEGKQVMPPEKEVMQEEVEVLQQEESPHPEGPDPALMYNFVLYGLPHVTLTSPPPS